MSLSETTERDLETFASEWLREDGVPGASIAVVHEDDLAYSSGFGSRDLDRNDPATAETLYGVGSVTKSVAALALAQLADRGALSFDDPVGEHVEFDLGGDITIHHLLTHSSGLPSLGVSEVLLARHTGMGEAGLPMGDRGDFRTHVRNAAEEIAAPPGERFFYCNTGYMLLGEIVEESTGTPFADYVEAEILDPLGMERSTFREAEFEAEDDRMTPYRLADGPEPTPFPFRELSHPNGGLVSSVTELSRYLRLQMGDGTIGGERVISRESLDRMHTGHVETPDGPYGYGWRRRSTLDRTLVGHSGSIGVASAYVGFTADREYGIAIAANASPDYPLAVIGEGVLAVLVGEELESVPFFARRERLDRLTGTYESYRGVRRAEVEERGGILELRFTDPFGGSPVPLVPTDGRIEGYTFETPTASGNRAPVEFDVSGGKTDLYYDRLRLHKVDN